LGRGESRRVFSVRRIATYVLSVSVKVSPKRILEEEALLATIWLKNISFYSSITILGDSFSYHRIFVLIYACSMLEEAGHSGFAV
jgi:hypothetical protein